MNTAPNDLSLYDFLTAHEYAPLDESDVEALRALLVGESLAIGRSELELAVMS